MLITLNGISIARSSNRLTKQSGWSATLPPGLADDRNKAYDLFNIGLVNSIECLSIMLRYCPV